MEQGTVRVWGEPVRAHWWQPSKRPCREVPVNYRPFTRAALIAIEAKEALWVVGPLLNMPASAATRMIDQAVWSAAEAALSYFTARRDAWDIRRTSDDLSDANPLRVTSLRTATAMNAHADELDAQTTQLCIRIKDVCTSIVEVRAELVAEDQVRAALRRADRRGAYSVAPSDPTVDLNDRVKGLTLGLRELASA